MRYLNLALALAAAVHGADAATFTGVITDTHCSGNHTMLKGQSDAACVKLCVKGSGEYALFDGQKTLRLSDQKNPAKFAGQKVTVVGAYQEKTGTIKVSAIQPSEQ
jgi:hypothetical protein